MKRLWLVLALTALSVPAPANAAVRARRAVPGLLCRNGGAELRAYRLVEVHLVHPRLPGGLQHRFSLRGTHVSERSRAW
jgi:hypothetical protein